jgi:photosystem II stability/assembly factor-like uncharacterized protein
MKKFYLSIYLFMLSLSCTLYTTGLNAQWISKIPQNNDTLWILYNQIIDPNTVWMGGNEYYFDTAGLLTKGEVVSIYNTADGGLNWNYKKFDFDMNPFLTGVTGINASIAWLSIYQLTSGVNTILKTEDGGHTWNIAASDLYTDAASFLNAITFKNEMDGLMIGDPTPDTDSTEAYFEIYRTNDGGNTWRRIAQSEIPPVLVDEYGISGEFSRVGDKVWFSTFSGRIYYSNDGGEHWDVSIAGTGYTGFLKFTDSLHGICGSEDTAISKSMELKYTDDGGLTWQPLSSPFKDSTYFWSVCLIPQSNYILTSNAATLQGAPFATMLSKDLGKSWIEILTGEGLATVSFISPAIGYSGEGISINQDHATKLYKYAGNPLTGIFSTQALDAIIELIPNPVTDYLNLQITSPVPTTINILINNVEGKLLWHKQTALFDHQHHELVDTKYWPAGTYNLLISDAHSSLSRQIIKQ